MADLTALSLSELSTALSRGDCSAVELTQTYLSRIQAEDPSIGAYLTVCPEEALVAAHASDERRRKGEILGALDGIPFAAKDNLCTKGIRTTCGSRFLENYLPPYDATVIERLTASGAVLLGKLNMDEFGMGSSTEHSAYHPTRNPHNLTRVPGGSSGGSAAALAAHLAAFTLGSDTGGSVRQPAALCGTVGLKPTYGTVSRYGLVAYASSLDQIGPLTKTVADSALVLQAIAGTDPRDATTLGGETPDFSALLGAPLEGVRVGLCEELLNAPLSAEIREAVLLAAKVLEALGAELTWVRLPSLSLSLPAYYLLSAAEASSNLARFDGVRFGKRAEGCETVEELYVRSRDEGFGAEVKRRILLGTFALSAGYTEEYYEKARRVRAEIRGDFDAAFRVCDLLLSPTTPSVAFPFGMPRENPSLLYEQDIYTVPASLAGLPALSLPFGTESGLPIGIQLTGRSREEALILCAAAALEREGGSR